MIFFQVLVILESTLPEQLQKEYSTAMNRRNAMDMPWKWNFIHFSEVFKKEIEFVKDEPSIDAGKVC